MRTIAIGLLIAAAQAAVTLTGADQGAAGAAARTVPASADGTGAVHVLPVQRNVYMLVGPNSNSAVQVGNDGVLLVDTQDAAQAPQIAAAIGTLSNKPIQMIIYTSFEPAHTGGTAALMKLGAAVPPMRVIAHENVLTRMVTADSSGTRSGAAFQLNAAISVPVNSEYFTPTRDFFYNGEAIVLYHVPSAHTDGDSLVFFRGSDVVSTGDLFNPDLYPMIDVQNGGSVNGVIAGLNRVLELTVPAKFQEGGTYVIPGRGRLCDEADVVEYRDMVTIIRDRVQDMVNMKMTLQQVKAARPTRDYDAEYGSSSGAWTTDMFVEAVYRSLTQVKPSK
jgi:cyclase